MNITIEALFEAGVHFGHQLRRWNPKSKEFIHGTYNKTSIIDLEKTYKALKESTKALESLVASGEDVLFVGTKEQAQELIREAGNALNMPFCANRWLGGTLTNFKTIKNSLKKYARFQKMDEDGILGSMHKKEASVIRREMSRMHRNFEGIQGLKTLPSAMFVVDGNHEKIAITEANRLGIPVFGLIDTNTDPSNVDYVIPGNDDAVKAIHIIIETVVEAVQRGLAQRSTQEPVINLNITAAHTGEAADISLTLSDEKSSSLKYIFN